VVAVVAYDRGTRVALHESDACLTCASGSITMWNRVVVIAGTCSLAAFVALASAAGPNPNRGRSLFKSTCKTCHVKSGEAKDFSPMTKTQTQWTRVFKKEITVMTGRVQAKTGKALTPSDVGDMQVFLVSHAADSDQPETCGIK
jgi:cytochrome c5